MSVEEVPMSMIQQMKKRISVRTYKEEFLHPELKEKLNLAFKDNQGPFGGAVRFEFVERELAQKEGNIKLGTYGIIKGASSYVVAAIPEGKRDLEDFGYVLEKLILYATSLGLGTCWLGGTYTKNEFSKAIGLQAGEIMPCITPIGYPHQKRSLLESAMRLAAGSKNRKPWQELFFNQALGRPLTEAEADNYATPLEMVRLAPSASNKQPWRIIMAQGRAHFYLQRTKDYGKGLGFDIQRVDMGIAMCHFELAAKELGLPGQWQIIESKADAAESTIPPGTHYIVSWV
ncbi:nitroreductase [Desulfitobacterium hafniense DCB-2]|uniref:Nitroreductase n=1 Tax=Desulfitobacterium hafniense (strain DSM 10664 / DCB-2) TaxID=272564 RepID=B8FVA8_DESHD|nr:nitroreductase family protein [Desulfitobacterium hafniense]ACL20617.1 nitroreductase [Desulfitobacterium hafniense DCB-2]